MTDNEEQKNKEEILSQFIDELNQEKKPSMHGLDMEEDQELYKLLDTVRAVKRMKTEDVPETPEFKVYNRGSRWKGLLKYGAIAASLMIAVMAVAGNRDTLRDGLYSKNGSSKGCSGVKEESQDTAGYADDKAKASTNSQRSSCEYIQKSSSEDIATVYSSCSAAASLIGGLPEGLQIIKAVKLEDSPYTYCVSCRWDKESFMDIYILPGVKGYDMYYQNNCYSLMDGIIEDNTDTVADINKAYGEAVSTLSWSGDGFTIMIVSDRGYDEVRSMLEKITGCKSVLLSQQERDKLK